jgi:hypothetical protein
MQQLHEGSCGSLPGPRQVNTSETVLRIRRLCRRGDVANLSRFLFLELNFLSPVSETITALTTIVEACLNHLEIPIVLAALSIQRRAKHSTKRRATK